MNLLHRYSLRGGKRESVISSGYCFLWLLFPTSLPPTRIFVLHRGAGEESNNTKLRKVRSQSGWTASYWKIHLTLLFMPQVSSSIRSRSNRRHESFLPLSLPPTTPLINLGPGQLLFAYPDTFNLNPPPPSSSPLTFPVL